MKKYVHLAIFVVAFLLILPIIPRASAVDLSVTIDQNQKVIINQLDAGIRAEPIGESGYYSTTISELKNQILGSDTLINPVLPYRQSLVVNDPLEPQTYLELINAEDFWDIPVDASDRVIALIDGGIALDHEDLVDRWAINDGEFGTTEDEGLTPNCTSRGLNLDKNCNNIDDDLNGYIDDWRGWDFIGVDNDPMVGTTNPTAPGVNHATLIAGLIGATGDNSIGVASLNWQSKILPLQIFSDDGDASTLELAEAIYYAIQMDVDVINLSLGSTEVDPTIEDLIDYARTSGIVVVAAAGNCSGSTYAENGCLYEGQMLYPASGNDTISVGASNLDDSWAYFSGRGLALDVLSPGAGMIKTTDYSSTNGLSEYSDSAFGSSYATPIVSGLVAKLSVAWPDATFHNIRSIIVDSAVKPSGMSGNFFTNSYGFGRVNPYAALTKANLCKNITFPSDINCDGSINLLDLSLLSSQWQKQNTGRSDINGSGLVDLLDLSLIASKWGQ